MGDRLIRGEGTSEAAWAPWLARTGARQVSHHELCPPGSRLVVVAPHPDDEVLACGGLLALRAAHGLPSLVVAVTDGEASHGTGEPSACARLAARRSQESYAGLQSLGVPPSCVVRIGVPDGQAVCFEAAVASRLRQLLQASDVVITTWCMDGHPDHEATAAATVQAARAAGCQLLQAPVWMWHWSAPGDSRIPWHDLVGLPLPKAAMRAKQHALQRHQSQLEPRTGGLGPVLVDSIVERASRNTEYFFA
ncbi:MAG: PIG-L family deacetylase [Comamonadaceae bacterium]|nr:MAG: PIG-L family deacetylase [Comamonadaceae bacterium]